MERLVQRTSLIVVNRPFQGGDDYHINDCECGWAFTSRFDGHIACPICESANVTRSVAVLAKEMNRAIHVNSLNALATGFGT